MNVLMLVGIAGGGALGALSRYGLVALVSRVVGDLSFPWGILITNVLGGLLMGILVDVFALRWSPSQEMQAFLIIGILGGFTTFSSFTLDVVLMYQRGDYMLAACYVTASVLLSCLALIIGMQIPRLF